MKTILAATFAALLAGTTVASAQQPTNPPFGDASQPRNDPQLQQENRLGTPSQQQGRTIQRPVDDTSTRNADPHQRSTRPNR